MSIGNSLVLFIVSALWVYIRLRDKGARQGAYAPGNPFVPHSESVALFGLFWLSLFPISLLALLAITLFSGNVVGITVALVGIGLSCYWSFSWTVRSPKCPGLDAVRAAVGRVSRKSPAPRYRDDGRDMR